VIFYPEGLSGPEGREEYISVLRMIRKVCQDLREEKNPSVFFE
jgi:hypothetical protein